ncbi:Ada metal-binding domain-containing protein [Elizabethkingia miricola]|uniref:Ada metal-binding domain-containing protein n=1 Tax=Elizabethkingia miricola TaxID=172045 RepID=UPI0038925D0A
MIKHIDISDSELRNKIRRKDILLGGNRKLKIYGTLSCTSGKRMKRENRIFFSSENEAIENAYRPCGHCMKEQYSKWKNGII